MFKNNKNKIIFEKIKKLKEKNIIVNNSKILIAFSGGPDSIFLYYLLKFLKKEYNLMLGIVYINHNIRSDVENDIEFVKKFASNEKIDLYISSIDVQNYSTKYKVSIETAARELRYKEIIKIQKENNYNFIATGHNLDDNVETFVFRMLRGTSLRGLKGIPEKRGNIIRPILNFKKQEILEFLNKNDIKYLIDYTNKENDYTRNFIRNEVFPMFEKINVNFRDKIVNIIEDIKKSKIHENDEYNLKKSKFISFLENEGVKINKNKIEKIFNKVYTSSGEVKREGSKKFYLGNGKILYNEYGNIFVLNEVIEKKDNFNNEHSIDKRKLIENSVINWRGYYISLKKNNKNLIDVNDKNKIDNSYFFVRVRKEGDKIFKEKIGNKKIKKIFIDKKIPKKDRNDVPIIVYKNNKLEKIIIVGDIDFDSSVKQNKSLLNNEKKYFFNEYEITIRRENVIKQ